MQLSSQIHKYRKAAHLTQEQLAAELGVTPQSVSNWERGGAPDISMLAPIANYFGISIDELMGNNQNHVQEQKRAFWRELQKTDDHEKRLNRIMEEYRKYPNDCYIIHRLITELLVHDDRLDNRIFIEELCRKVLSESPDPDLRESVLYTMCRISPKDEREKWLSRLPRKMKLRQQNVRAMCRILDHDYTGAADSLDLLRVIQIDEILMSPIPDQIGPERKGEVQRKNLAVLDTLRENGVLPNAWLGAYAYKALVLSACFFESGLSAEGWEKFASAAELYADWFRLPDDELLETGCGNIRLTKDRNLAVLPDGSREYIGYCTYRYADTPSQLLRILNDRTAWAWMNSARRDRRFTDIVEWVQSLVQSSSDM